MKYRKSNFIAIKVSKEIIKDIFAKNPDVYDYVANILAQRKIKLNKKKKDNEKTQGESKNITQEIKKAIMSFLS